MRALYNAGVDGRLRLDAGDAVKVLRALTLDKLTPFFMARPKRLSERDRLSRQPGQSRD